MEIGANKKEVTGEEKNQTQVLTNEEILGLPIEEILTRLGTSQSGLSSEEVEKRLEAHGYNELARRKKRTAIAKFLSNFKNPLVIILLIAGTISAFFGELVNAIIIYLMVLMSMVLLFYQESRAEKAAEMLKKKVTTTSTLLRDGQKKEVNISWPLTRQRRPFVESLSRNGSTSGIMACWSRYRRRRGKSSLS